ncbi:MAG: CinA family nicotinamide mononucleotide deamidase-related protein [Anaerolinea sp.]|nr:CinA family nicotinamide mononucleotide deamidase-related protein [Anaerolinea sp.]
MHAEIVSIGEELLSSDSDTLDTNSVYITKQLGAIGVRVLYKTTVGDDEKRIIEVLKLALSRTQIVVTTGGLGPTVDDMTRQGVAETTGRPLQFHQELLDDIAAKFARFGARMSDNNRIQAMLPEGAITINNPTGTAPGFIVEHQKRIILSLPGVPREMKAMMEQTVIPYLRQKVGTPAVIKTRVIRLAGIGESLIDEQIGHLEKLTNPTVGLNAHTGQVDVRITARTATEEEAAALIQKVEEEVRAKLGAYIYGVDREPLEAAFNRALKDAGMRIALIEIGTQGMLSRRLESQPEALAQIDVLDEALVAQFRLEIDPQADSRATAERLVSLALSHTRHVAAVVLIAGENSMAVCVSVNGETRSRGYGYGTSTTAPDMIAGWGLSILWWMLTHKGMGKL